MRWGHFVLVGRVQERQGFGFDNWDVGERPKNVTINPLDKVLPIITSAIVEAERVEDGLTHCAGKLYTLEANTPLESS